MSTHETLRYCRTRKGEWRWRLIGRNGKIVANSGESFKRIAGAEKNWYITNNCTPNVVYADETPPSFRARMD
jgi:hypothetical protein